MAQRISDRLGKGRFGRHAPELSFEPALHRVPQRPALRLAAPGPCLRPGAAPARAPAPPRPRSCGTPRLRGGRLLVDADLTWYSAGRRQTCRRRRVIVRPPPARAAADPDRTRPKLAALQLFDDQLQ